MIEKIKKYTFLVHHSDYDNLLNSFREAGVVHIIEKRKIDESPALEKDLNLLKRYKSAIHRLSEYTGGLTSSNDNIDPEKVLDEFNSLLKNIGQSEHHIEVLKSEAERCRPWGSFDPDAFEKLKESGWSVSLYSCPEKRFEKTWQENYALEIIGRGKGKLFFAVAHRDDFEPDIRADKENLPQRTAKSLFTEIEVYEKKIEEMYSRLRLNAPLWIYSLNKGTNDIISRIEYSEAAEQADKYAEDNLYVLEGWIPVSEEIKIKELLLQSNCYSFVSEPEPDEKIPVILKNNWFSELFEPITKLFALPDYRELDLTPFFAPFFMLFFGFCLGDAGYGLFFIIAGFLIKRKISKSYRKIVTLGQYFGIAAVLMGLLSGTFFGINLIDSDYTITEQSVVQMKKEGVPEKIISELMQVKDVMYETRKDYASQIIKIIGEDNYSEYKNVILKNADTDFTIIKSFRHFMLDSLNMFYLAIFIGALQIIFGMILRIFNITRKKGFKYSLSTVGWVLLIITLVIFKGGGEAGLLPEEQTKPFFISLLIAAGILIFLFNTPGLNVFLRIGKGVWDSYNVLTGIFGDLLSYIRLFALGISSSILGFVFNEISLQMLPVPYVGWLLFLLLLIVGHSMNIAIATLGSFVHPMRLTFVEFYKNAGFTGGGIEYKPFKIKQ